jgi:hypothetical protein
MTAAMKIPTEITEWQRAETSVERAQKERLAAIQAALPPGREVTWRHGEHLRSGTVVSVKDCWWSDIDVKVRSTASGAEYWVGAWSILQFELGR